MYEGPRIVLCLEGSPPVTGKRYYFDRLRCNLCGAKFEAYDINGIKNLPKYADNVKTAIAISRYYMGIPFKRLETIQSNQEVPLPDATQWDLIVELYDVAKFIFCYLEVLAANGDIIYEDDTTNRIREQIPMVVNGKLRKGCYTSAFISMVEDKRIYLFYTSHRYAGENLELILTNRTSSSPLITMSDASRNNMPKTMPEELFTKWVMCFCLSHGRRKFFECFNQFEQECDLVLEIISEVYKNERHCKKEGYDSKKRLQYHQEHSMDLMNSLKAWFNNQLIMMKTEDNSALGDSIRYMLKHWQALTQFLHVAGAPIDNNICEQAIKVAIRHRRNSLFYKTPKGAKVGDCLMSILHTAAQNGANIYDYLDALQQYAEQVKGSPPDWLPWNYQATIAQLNQKIAA